LKADPEEAQEDDDEDLRGKPGAQQHFDGRGDPLERMNRRHQ
jgi:hypothetical protein